MLSNCDLVSNVSPLLIFCRYQMKCKSVSNVSPRYTREQIESRIVVPHHTIFLQFFPLYILPVIIIVLGYFFFSLLGFM